MKKTIFYIFIMLLALSAAFSCDNVPEHINNDSLYGPHSLVVSGIVSDKDTKIPFSQ